MVTCNCCGSEIKAGEPAGDLTTGIVKRILLDAMEEEWVPDYEPSGDEWFLCDDCAAAVVKFIHKRRGERQ